MDEALWSKLSSGGVVDGLKYSLVAGGVVMMKSLDQLKLAMVNGRGLKAPPTVGGA